MLMGMPKGLSMGLSLGLPISTTYTSCDVRLHYENDTFEAGYALLRKLVTLLFYYGNVMSNVGM